MKQIRALIVDDEDLARQILREYLSEERDVEVVGECTNGFDAVKAVTELKPDLLFLDVQMPKLDGFEVLDLVGTEIAVVFVTAYDQYAMKAFDAAAVDYLLKPFELERFRTALQRSRRRLEEKTPSPAVDDLRRAASGPGQHLQRIVIRDNARVHIIPVDQLDYVEAEDDYIGLHTGGKKYLKQQTISSLEASLDPARFIRVHRSFIINLDKLGKIEPYTKDTKLAVLTDGSQVPVSRAGYMRLRELVDSK
ncbi:MAG TPA: response regulator [Bryobacteraceae bacterium]|nr:response regulator [Bryobacteraceae bacterium]